MGGLPTAPQGLMPGVGGIGQVSMMGMGAMPSPQPTGNTMVSFSPMELQNLMAMSRQQQMMQQQQQQQQVQQHQQQFANTLGSVVTEAVEQAATKIMTTPKPEVLVLPKPRPRSHAEQEVVHVDEDEETPEMTPVKSKKRRAADRTKAKLLEAQTLNESLTARLKALEEVATTKGDGEEGRRARSRQRAEGGDSDDDVIHRSRNVSDSPAKHTRSATRKVTFFDVAHGTLTGGSPATSEAESSGRASSKLLDLMREAKVDGTVDERQSKILQLLKMTAAKRVEKIAKSMKRMLGLAVDQTKDKKVPFPTSIPLKFPELLKVAQCIVKLMAADPGGKKGDGADLQARTILVEGVLQDGVARLPKKPSKEGLPRYIGKVLYWLLLCRVDVGMDDTLSLVWDMATDDTVNMDGIVVVD